MMCEFKQVAMYSLGATGSAMEDVLARFEMEIDIRTSMTTKQKEHLRTALPKILTMISNRNTTIIFNHLF
jgi:hypothetical protein